MLIKERNDGVLTKVRNGIVKAAEKGADAVSAMSQLSPAQVRAIDDRRQQYLSEMPSMDDEFAEEITKRNIGAISIEINNSYLPQISSVLFYQFKKVPICWK